MVTHVPVRKMGFACFGLLGDSRRAVVAFADVARRVVVFFVDVVFPAIF